MQKLKNIVVEVRQVGRAINCCHVLHVQHSIRKSHSFTPIPFLMAQAAQHDHADGESQPVEVQPSTHKGVISYPKIIITEQGTLVWNEADASTCDEAEIQEEEQGTDDDVVEPESDTHEEKKEDRDQELEEENQSKGTYQERFLKCFLVFQIPKFNTPYAT